MICLVSSFAIGFALIKGGLPWWSLIVTVLVLIIADTVFGDHSSEPVDSGFDR